MDRSNKDIPLIGQMKWRISLLGYVKTNDAKSNEENLAYSVATTVWAKVDFLNGDQKIIDGGEYSLQGVLVYVRYNSAFEDKKKRLRIDGSDYHIDSVSIIGDKEYLKIKCMKIE